MKKFILSILVVASVVMSGCSNFFNEAPNNMLVSDDHFSSKSNVLSAYAGLLSTLQNIAAQNIIISDLRGDVLSPTAGAPDAYWDVFKFKATNGNELVDPTSYYNIVVNANDFLRKTMAYNKAYPGHLEDNEYIQMMASAVTIRAWTYLQIGKIYGEAAYFDYSMPSDKIDLSTIPMISFDELIPELIYAMEVGVDGISAQNRADLDILFDVDGTYWRRLNLPADVVLMELAMWRKDYTTAASLGLRIIKGESLFVFDNINSLTVSNVYGGDKWSTIFSKNLSNDINNEGLAYVMFDSAKAQENELHRLFSATPPNKYYMMPNDHLQAMFISSCAYGQPVGGTISIDDTRFFGTTIGYEQGQTVLMKYHCNGRDYFDRDAPIFFYRASEVHLMIAEALVALGDFEAADILLNDGMKTKFVKGDTFDAPFEAPIYQKGELAGNIGVRGRVGAPIIRSTDANFYYNVDMTDSVAVANRQAYVLDSLIANETALEFAGEGKRWFTLLRMARNNDDPSILIDRVIQKFPAEEQYRYKILLSDPSMWFVNYDLKSENLKLN